MAYEIVDETQGLVIRLSGDLQFSELLGANVDCSHHPGNPGHTYQIWDFTEVDRIEMDDIDAVGLARTGNTILGQETIRKVALIMNRPEFNDIRDAYLTTVDNASFEACAFTTIEAARDWIVQD